ncbi:hypothetical protein P7K49_018345 [Saguinus oedipus]|uniref:Uncharacterized protein n=1 Tax=Saguinus oedipus TaxID=9490 RepID=A0ABQ9V559_SAGOE|nr:hypothetical protein P7K49_018345 [Saguinus oedipus]
MATVVRALKLESADMLRKECPPTPSRLVPWFTKGLEGLCAFNSPDRFSCSSSEVEAGEELSGLQPEKQPGRGRAMSRPS